MDKRIYHARRLILSYTYQYLLLAISWAVSVKRPYYLILYFSGACILAGTAFTYSPNEMAAFFEFENLNDVAATDVRAYYGTMLIALGLVLAWLAKTTEGARAALLIISAFSLGSAIGRILGFLDGTSLFSIHGFLCPIEIAVTVMAMKIYKRSFHLSTKQIIPRLNPATPEEFQPLSQHNFTNPYAYYKMLRDDYPVYYMQQGEFYMVSRYEDIITIAKDTEAMSNKLVEILATGKPKDPNKTGPSAIETMGDWGILPVDVFALQDPPIHTKERKVGHMGFNAKLVKGLEKEVEMLCDEMMDEFIPHGSVEFIQSFAWRLPMRLIIRLLGFPEKDFEQIKDWCVDGLKSLSGTATKAESIEIGASAAKFVRYIWSRYLWIKEHPSDNFTSKLAKLSDDPENIMTDQRIVATILQLLIAGSDSSASSMGSAVRLLASDPELEQRLRNNPDDIPLFIEEVFRTESAFQGHFRLTKKAIELHGEKIPVASRVFLMWASGNRDERFWDDPETFNMDRANVKKHLTFGHGIHACLGRELARMEIRIVIRKLLERTEKIGIVGDTPYEASIFARTLVSLPLAFEAKSNLSQKKYL